MQIGKNFRLAALLVLLVLACMGCTNTWKTARADIPQEVYDCADSYADALMNKGASEAAHLLYFKDESQREIFAESSVTVQQWKLETVEKVNPSLYALTLSVETREDGKRTVYNYVVKLDGQYWYIIHQRDIPDKLQENFDPERYKYDSENILSDDDIVIAG